MALDFIPLFNQVPLTTLVPSWFYVFSGLTYLLVGVIGLSISYFSYKLFRITGSKSHLTLALSFLLISAAFGSLTAISLFTYQNYELNQNIFILNQNVYNVYYLLSLTAYFLLVVINLPKKKDKLYPAFIPLWFIDSVEFHSAALLMMIYVAGKSVINFFKVRSQDAFLVMLSFLMITLFHVFLLLMPFGIELYLVAHLFLVTGFLSLLFMLIRVTRK